MQPIRKDYAKANGGPYKGFNLNYVMPDPAGSLEPVWWKPGMNPQVSTTGFSLSLHLHITETPTPIKHPVASNNFCSCLCTGSRVEGEARNCKKQGPCIQAPVRVLYCRACTILYFVYFIAVLVPICCACTVLHWCDHTAGGKEGQQW